MFDQRRPKCVSMRKKTITDGPACTLDDFYTILGTISPSIFYENTSLPKPLKSEQVPNGSSSSTSPRVSVSISFVLIFQSVLHRSPSVAFFVARGADCASKYRFMVRLRIRRSSIMLPWITICLQTFAMLPSSLLHAVAKAPLFRLGARIASQNEPKLCFFILYTISNGIFVAIPWIFAGGGGDFG